MLRSMNSSPYPAHDDHLRHLLDQRSARADINSRFSAVSEYSDTPSVYSHRFSPIPHDRGEPDFNVQIPDVDTFPRQRFNPESRSPLLSDRDLLNDPSASGLDLDDDYRSSYGPSNSYEDDNEPTLNPADVEEDTRMSMLGPKMRIHGRAPWEMGEETLDEGGESDSSAKSRAFSTKRAKGKSEGFMRGFGRGSSNPRPPLANRTSDESNRSYSRSKGSFETTASGVSNSQGPHLSSSPSSVSSTSLSIPPSESSGKGSSLRNKFSMPRVRSNSRTPSYNDSRSKSSLPPSPRSTLFSNSPTTSEYSRTSSASSSRPSISPSPNDEDFVHPYANPDLVLSYVSDPPPISPHRGQFSNISRSDSISTITDVQSTSSHSTLMHMPSASSPRQIDQPAPRANITGRGISSPINSFRPNDLLPPKIKEPHVLARPPPLGPNGIPGWMDNPGSPTIQLISLAEAQAQAKERARSATMNGVVLNPSVPFPDRYEKSPSPINSMRSRARSISAGAKAKSALSNMIGGPPAAVPERRDSEPAISPTGVAGKSLKHRKSGFMRMFNGKDRETVPPVPTLADEYTAHNNSHPPLVQNTPKISPSRASIPSLGSYSIDESPSSASSSSNLSDAGFPRVNLSPKRTPPPLHIHTSSHSPRTPAKENLTLSMPTIDKSVKEGGVPLSAPPSTSDFPSLSLRPVSTIFSAHFADHIVALQADSDFPAKEEPASDTPMSSSPGTERSPLTSGFSLRSDETTTDSGSITANDSEDQSSVIQTLREQIVSARKAWQHHIWELEGQVRDLKAEVDNLRSAGHWKEYCEVCGRGEPVQDGHNDTRKVGVVNRPRARTGDAARFGNGK